MSHPAVLAFDVAESNLSMSIGIENKMSLRIQTNNNTESITEIIENTLNKNPDHEDETLGGEKIIIERNESKSGVIDKNNKLVAERPQLINKDSNKYLIFDDSLNELSNGSIAFFLTETPKSDNYIISELGTYEEKYKEAVTITPFILEFEQNNPILLDVDEHSLSFLLLGNECSKDFSKSPTTIYTKIANGKSSKEYQDTNLIKAPYRGRFVISNNGRIITFSIYNKETQNWDNVRELIFDIEKIDEKHHIIFSVSNSDAISNITANF